MKTKQILCSVLMMTLLLAGCGNQSNNTETNTSVDSRPEETLVSEQSEEEEIPLDMLDAGREPIVVADASMYRGTVVDLELQGDTMILLLEQATGSNFGYPQLQVAVGPDTNLNFDATAIENGKYLEVYYGVPLGTEIEQPVTAIAINELPDAELSIYNGTVVEHTSDSDSSGSILLQELDGENAILFSYDEETQCYLDLGALSEGDQLNVFFSGITTRSIPPQGHALEIRLYVES